jgi:DNA-binding NtrC family response regulator
VIDHALNLSSCITDCGIGSCFPYPSLTWYINSVMAQKILVVDDEDLILASVERVLAKAGYSISCARDMKELDEALADGPFDLLITDIFIREGGSLGEVIEKVRETSPSVKVLKMSGAVKREITEDFIEKPFSIEALRKKVKEILHGPS